MSRRSVYRMDSTADSSPASDDVDEVINDDAGETSRDDTAWEWRDDLGDLLRPSMQIDSGRMMVEGIVAKPGILLYTQPDGSIIRELVLPEELHRGDSLATLGQAPLTLEHPPEPVTSENVADFAVGNVGDDVEVIQDNGFVRVRMVIRRSDAQDDVRANRRRELSPGYRVRIERRSGIHPDYGPFDQIQRDRRYNHLALTEAARGGRQIRLRADSAYQLVHPDNPEASMTLYERLLKALTAGGTTRADAEAMLAPLLAAEPGDGSDNTNTKRDDAASAARQLMEGALVKAFDALERQNNTLQGQLDALNAAANAKADQGEDEDEAPKHDALIAFHRERTQLESLATANGIDPAAAEILAMDNAGLRRAIVTKINPDVRTDADDAYFLAFLDVHTKAAGTKSSAYSHLGTGDGRRNDGTSSVDPADDNTKARGDNADKGWNTNMAGAFDQRKSGAQA